MAKLIQIQLENGEKIFIEIKDDYEASGELTEQVSAAETIKTKGVDFLNQSLAQIKSFSEKISESFQTIDITPDEIEIEFGAKFSSEAGVIFTSIGGETS